MWERTARHLLDVRDINQAALSSGNNSSTAWLGLQYTYQQTDAPLLQPVSELRGHQPGGSEATSNYNSLQALLRTTNWHRVSTQMTYTFSHSLDEESGLIPYLPQTALTLRASMATQISTSRILFRLTPAMMYPVLLTGQSG